MWTYCLMPNHVHLIVAPERGHLWQGRFASFVMDERHLLTAARYVELNPVRARLARKPWRWKWSSAAAHRKGKDDLLAMVAPLLDCVGDWQGFLSAHPTEGEVESIRKHERTGRPLGSFAFLDKIEATLSRVLRPQKRGPQPQRRKRKRRGTS